MRVHPNRVKNGQKWVKMTFSKNDTEPFGVSVEVFLARSEDSLSRFDLRRVVWFTDPQCAFQKIACPSKGGQWGQRVLYQKERNTPPSART